MTYQLIETKTLTSAQAAIEFTSIPQTYTDLIVLFSVRSQRTGANDDPLGFRLNASNSGYSLRQLSGSGSSVFTVGGSDTAMFCGYAPTANMTADTFANGSIYLPNYSGGTNKSSSVEMVGENNATLAYQTIVANLWSNTGAITSLALLFYQTSQNFSIGSTVSLYGITRGTDGIVIVS